MTARSSPRPHGPARRPSERGEGSIRAHDRRGKVRAGHAVAERAVHALPPAIDASVGAQAAREPRRPADVDRLIAAAEHRDQPGAAIGAACLRGLTRVARAIATRAGPTVAEGTGSGIAPAAEHAGGVELAAEVATERDLMRAVERQVVLRLVLHERGAPA